MCLKPASVGWRSADTLPPTQWRHAYLPPQTGHCQRDTSVQIAALLMRQRHVGDLIVAEQPNGERVPIGILTDRDILSPGPRQRRQYRRPARLPGPDQQRPTVT
ncbi:CBS domain-containing protein [Janthinobacterium sp. UMAB-56]|uniref:CBS domain-containing protein n=1 Tax=Janthinobacterium sp. UMAB-56 TaxID=1365361 RepID=UPI0035ABEC53